MEQSPGTQSAQRLTEPEASLPLFRLALPSSRLHCPIHLGRTTGSWVAGRRTGVRPIPPVHVLWVSLGLCPTRNAARERPILGWGQEPRSRGQQREADLRKANFWSSGAWPESVVFPTSLSLFPLHGISRSGPSSPHPSPFGHVHTPLLLGGSGHTPMLKNPLLCLQPSPLYVLATGGHGIAPPEAASRQPQCLDGLS